MSQVNTCTMPTCVNTWQKHPSKAVAYLCGSRNIVNSLCSVLWKWIRFIFTSKRWGCEESVVKITKVSQQYNPNLLLFSCNFTDNCFPNLCEFNTEVVNRLSDGSVVVLYFIYLFLTSLLLWITACMYIAVMFCQGCIIIPVLVMGISFLTCSRPITTDWVI